MWLAPSTGNWRRRCFIKNSYRTISDLKLQVQQDTPPLVVWKMKAPEKKPLVRREAPEEVRAKVSKILVIRHLGKTA